VTTSWRTRSDSARQYPCLTIFNSWGYEFVLAGADPIMIRNMSGTILTNTVALYREHAGERLKSYVQPAASGAVSVSAVRDGWVGSRALAQHCLWSSCSAPIGPPVSLPTLDRQDAGEDYLPHLSGGKPALGGAGE